MLDHRRYGSLFSIKFLLVLRQMVFECGRSISLSSSGLQATDVLGWARGRCNGGYLADMIIQPLPGGLGRGWHRRCAQSILVAWRGCLGVVDYTRVCRTFGR